jgi:hypothetical protein
MDHEKPQAVSPQIFDISGETTQSTYDTGSGLIYDRPPSVEESAAEKTGRERRGESVW